MTVLLPRGTRVVLDRDKPGFLKTIPCDHDDDDPCLNCRQWIEFDERVNRRDNSLRTGAVQSAH